MVEKDPYPWYGVAAGDVLLGERVVIEAVANGTSCLTHADGQYARLGIRCPHRGYPPGEGLMEPAWGSSPLTGKVPGFRDCFESFLVAARHKCAAALA